MDLPYCFIHVATISLSNGISIARVLIYNKFSYELNDGIAFAKSARVRLCAKVGHCGST